MAIASGARRGDRKLGLHGGTDRVHGVTRACRPRDAASTPAVKTARGATSCFELFLVPRGRRGAGGPRGVAHGPHPCARPVYMPALGATRPAGRTDAKARARTPACATRHALRIRARGPHRWRESVVTRADAERLTRRRTRSRESAHATTNAGLQGRRVGRARRRELRVCKEVQPR